MKLTFLLVLGTLLAGPLLAFNLGETGTADSPKGKFSIVQAVSVPPVATVGEPVELHLTLLPQKGIQIVKSQDAANEPWVKIQNVEVVHTPPYVQVLVRYVSFAPGNKTLPPIPLGDIVLKGLSIQTASVLNPQNLPHLAPPRSPLALPQTGLFLFLTLAALLVLPFLIWYLSVFATSLMKRLKKARARKKPYRILLKQTRALSQNAAGMRGPEFYSDFSILLRTYLTGRFGLDFIAATAPEFSFLLRSLPGNWSADWVRLIRRADNVRFDQQEPPLAERLEDLQALKTQAGYLESGEGLHVDL
ncbi:MAG: hypothetical protein HKM06_05880 [Spirochaetales bacterium]|nr:hypothetical protein [Spirochaetales bacterium]